MLAYVFWHQPKAGVEPADYEETQRSFLAALDTTSASFRVIELPFQPGGGYEDWYLLEGWQELGELNAAAVDSLRLAPHDRLAAMSADGWGSIYELVRGAPEIPDGAEWLDKPRGEPSPAFVASLPEATVWRRQMVLGPAPEFCLARPPSAARERVWPRA
jgi:hypothetical protein